MGKTYRKIAKDKPRRKKQRAWKKFQFERKIQREIDDYENQKEVSELSDEILQADS